MLTALIRWRDRHRARRALRFLLRKPGEHLLADIGLTRHELRHLLGLWED